MWSHYAQSHQGFCIGFSKASLIAEYPNNYVNEQMSSKLDPLVPVIYSASRAEPALAKDEIASPEVFHTKSLDWKYEQEWRLFANLADCEEGNKKGKDSKGREICLLKVPHYSIAEIIIGWAAEDELNSKIIDFARSKKLPVYKVVLPVETFYLHREEVLLS